MRASIAYALTVALALVAPAGMAKPALSGFALDDDSITQWKLPHKLREVSGLATMGNRLFAHADESAIVYELDYDDGRLLKAFALGKRTLRGDFEGIAILDRRFFLVTSDGVLYEFNEGDNGQRVPFVRYETGLGDRCEIEGLATDRARGNLMMVCKQPRTDRLRGKVAIFAWSVAARRLAPDDDLMVSQADITAAGGAPFNPSGIEFHGATGHWLLVGARQRMLVEIDRNGAVVVAMRLPRARLHRQAEGIALLADGRLALADEGGSKKGRLALYRPTS